MTAELTYVAVWPIVDRTRPVSALITEARGQLAVMVELAGVRIVRKPTWSVSTDAQRLVCLATARTFDPDRQDDLRGTVSATVRAHIHQLATAGMTIRQIAERVGLSPRTVGRYARQVR
jgi:hypothetical protein